MNELRLAGIVTLEGANTYLRDRFMPDYDARFSHPPADPTPAFVALGDIDLDQILCEEEERTVAPDNTVSFDTVRVQLAKHPGRPTWAGVRVIVRRHLAGRLTVWRGPTRLGLYAASGVALSARVEQAANGHFRVAGAHLPPMPPTAHCARRRRALQPSWPSSPRRPRPVKSGQITCQTRADRSLANNKRLGGRLSRAHDTCGRARLRRPKAPPIMAAHQSVEVPA